MYRLEFPPILIQDGSVQFKLNTHCLEVDRGDSNLFSLKITYKSDGGTERMPSIKFENNVFDVLYGKLPCGKVFTITITLSYGGMEVETYEATGSTTKCG